MERKEVVIVSEYNGISVSLVERFLSNFFSVKVVCVKKTLWQKYAPYLLSNNFFSIGSFDNKEILESDSSVFVSCFYDNLFFYKEREIFLNEKERLFSFLSRVVSKRRKLIILPYLVYEKIGLGLVRVYDNSLGLWESKNLYVCFVDEVFGPRVILSPRSEVGSLLRCFYAGGKSFFVSEESYIKICLLGDFSRKFVNFVLTPDSGKERRILFSGKTVNRGLLLDVLKEQKRGFLDRLRKTFIVPKKAVFDSEIELSETLDRRKVVEILAWFREKHDDFFVERRKEVVRGGQAPVDKSRYIRDTRTPKVRIFPLLTRKIKSVIGGKVHLKPKARFPQVFGFRFSFFVLKFVVFFLFFVLVIPLLPVVLGGASIYFGYKAFINFNLSRALLFIKTSKKISYVLSGSFYSMSRFPVFGNYYLFLGDSLSLVDRLSHTFDLGISVARSAPLFCEKSLKGQEIDLVKLSRSLFLDLNSLYFQASLLEGSLDVMGEKYVFLEPLLGKLDFSRHRRGIASAREITLLLPEILGEKEEKKYLVLFQNNMELRATGGFIGSFAVLTFKKGALVNFEVYDVYTADGQLRGYVAPPWPIKVHLNQSSWYLRDSNWDPDFSISAKRAEWFLDKSMGIEVDGVFSFDTIFVKDLISVIGQLNVTDYNKVVNDKIFYDVVQYESEKDFFPGSRQKSNFLTALSKSLLFEIRDAEPKKILSLLPVFYRNLDERHLQLFFNNDVLQEKIGFLGWDGRLRYPSCFSENCFEDFIALVESNFGVNKVNYFVSRSVNLKIDVEGPFLRREMEVVFDNRAPLVLGDKGKYKNYLRVFVPAGSVVERVLIENNNNNYFETGPDQNEVRGMKEIGFLVEIFPESTRKVTVVWKEEKAFDLSKNGEYRFVFRKQAGIEVIPFNFKLSFPSGFKIASDNLQLTREGFFVYNQPSLRGDFSARFYW